MDAVPMVVAPPGIQQGAEFIAGEFMRTIAQGSGGMRSEVTSQALGDGVDQVHLRSERRIHVFAGAGIFRQAGRLDCRQG